MKEDSFLMKGRRKRLVDAISAKGINDQKVLKAILEIPRHFFTLEGLEQLAYDDKALSITDEQTISQPFTVAFQTQLLNLDLNDKVLEIGTGSGYQAAVLSQIGVKVFSIERIKNLHEKSTKLLKKYAYDNVRTFFGDGYKGLPDFAPFDKIIITAAILEIPEELLSQLKIGGMMVAPVGISGYSQKMTRIIRKSESNFEKQYFGDFVFVPMVKGVK
ncbi:MAG: protein-L-isoaspartate(D-aspartate) O-methyltransferase [Bacteroidota bacterium]|nr:protein-L-isoaspartate(D-aspartate) O-methyltransferase [Bacteroidota bacterium]